MGTKLLTRAARRLLLAAALVISGSATTAQTNSTMLLKDWGTANNTFLGRWKANSTAGQAVLKVLTIEPNRVRWGTVMNGACDSTYSVKILPQQRNGRFPDQLVPPSSPSNLEYRVARLTLKPGPCNTRDAVVQLAMPMDDTNTLQVVTYDDKGNMIGNYPDLQRVR
jgi:hypothetical protein